MMKAFVNRAQEMGVLTRAFDAASGGKGGCVFVEGEAGLGKTKLVEEFLEYCSRLGATVLGGKCQPGDTEPYRVFARILSKGMEGEVTTDDMRMPVGLMPIFGKKRFDFDMKKAREMAFEKLFQAVLELGEGRTLVMFIDDIQWSDTASLHLLFYIARNIKTEKILVCATYRPEELADGGHPFLDTMQRMRRENLFTKIKLEPLSKEHSKVLIEKRIAEEGLSIEPSALLERVFEQTNGNPFYIEETIKLAGRDGLGVVPSTISELLKARLSKLTTGEIEVVSAAAVLGKEFTFNMIKEMLGLEEEAMLDVLDKLVGQYVFNEDEFGEELCYKFGQDMLWEVIYSSIPADEKKRLHKKASEMLAKMAEKKGEHVFQLADHYLKAGEEGLAFNYLIKSAKRAADSFAFEDAISYYKSALRITNKDNEAQIRLEMGEIYKSAGEWEAALEFYRSAHPLLKDDHSRAKSRRGVAFIMSKRGGWPEAEQAYQESIEFSKRAHDEEGIAEALLGLGWSLWRQGKYDEASEKYVECLDIADRLESRELIIRATLGIGHIMAERGDLEGAIERYSRCLSASITIDDLDNQAVAHNSLGIVFDKSGDRRDAIEHYLKAIECARSRGNVRMVGIGSLNAGEMLAKEMRFDEAREKLDEAMAIFRRLDEKFLIAGVHVARGIMHKLGKDLTRCKGEFEQGIEMLESVGAPYYLGYSYYEYGLACKSFGDMARAAKLFERSRTIFTNIKAKDDLERVEKELSSVQIKVME